MSIVFFLLEWFISLTLRQSGLDFLFSFLFIKSIVQLLYSGRSNGITISSKFGEYYLTCKIFNGILAQNIEKQFRKNTSGKVKKYGQ